MNFLHINHLSFRYPGHLTGIINDFSCSFPEGWTAVTGVNGCGKTTLLKLISGELTPENGQITGEQDIYFCAQEAESPPELLDDLLADYSPRTLKIISRLAVEYDWPWRWDSLSGGEKKRAQIACSLFRDPEVLILDEPTNHLDITSRDILLSELKEFKGIGLLVCHDQWFLDQLCEHTMFMMMGRGEIRKGNYSTARDAMEQEQQYQRALKKNLSSQMSSLKQESSRRKEKADKVARAIASKKHIHPKDKDAKAKIDGARVSGKDKKSAQVYKQLEGRIKKLENQVDDISFRAYRKTGITMAGKKGSRDAVFHLDPGVLELGEKRSITYPELVLRPGEKAAVIGSNGCGKTTLLRHIHSRLMEGGDSKSTLPADVWLYIPQEIPEELKEKTIKQLKVLDNTRRGDIYAFFSRLGSDPLKLNHPENLSPGELRKVLLCMSFHNGTEFIMMDEPTNHMDLHSIEALSEALKGFSGALLLVSHNRAFLKETTSLNWNIGMCKENTFSLTL